ncbi:hypothetical protein [Streptomyces sp. NPDC051211]|uniref:hypothetical protein n=1 Tax=Streptomyces sp. NPDC051211 TaxID=3154643 RepID=UPI003450B360
MLVTACATALTAVRSAPLTVTPAQTLVRLSTTLAAALAAARLAALDLTPARPAIPHTPAPYSLDGAEATLIASCATAAAFIAPPATTTTDVILLTGGAPLAAAVALRLAGCRPP